MKYDLAHPIVMQYSQPISKLGSDSETDVNLQTNMNNLLDKTEPLPLNVRLQSVRAVSSVGTTFVVRLQHLFAVGEDPVQSMPAVVDLEALVLDNILASPANALKLEVVEMTLDAGVPLSSLERLEWNVTAAEARASMQRHDDDKTEVMDVSHVTMLPFQLRTFLVSVQPKNMDEQLS